MTKIKLMLGDNIASLKKLEDNSVDSVVTDPPYGLSFMNKKWDYDVPSVEFWKEVYRVLKPGGHVLSFGGTRTYHRMVVNIEDAGFEIRDQIMWLYGSGFPKSHNIGKAVDKLQGNEREVVGDNPNARPNFEGKEQEDGLKGVFRWQPITKGNSPYEGWGTALKPANEPICVARKPISEKTIAKNVLKWGTGGINVDGCRIKTQEELGRNNKKNPFDNNVDNGGIWNRGSENVKPLDTRGMVQGRFPANIILDEIAGEYLDEQSGFLKGDSPNRKPRKGGHRKEYVGTDNNEFKNKVIADKIFDSGGASRFFYQAKVSKKERNMGLDGFEEKETTKNTHPTVKPVNLMTYLCRLVTPKDGVVLDPFMGSGSTGISAQLEGFNFIGMEMDEYYFKIAESRIESFEEYRQFIKNK